MVSLVYTRVMKDMTYNSRMSTSVIPSGNPVAGFCLDSRFFFARTPASYALLICGLIFGNPGYALVTATIPTAIAPKICLMLGMLKDVVCIGLRKGEWRKNISNCKLNKTSLSYYNKVKVLKSIRVRSVKEPK